MTAAAALSPRERKALKARAHRLEPVVWIGDDGLSGALLAEVERALAAHELIKVRAAAFGREAREAALAELCARCAAQPVQHIGKVLVIYRKKPEAESAPRRHAPDASSSQLKALARPSRSKRATPRR